MKYFDTNSNTQTKMSFSNANTKAIDAEIVNLLTIMKQKELRRYKRFLFTMYNKTKIYVSIREFVWTHIVHPYLAEATCDRFYKQLVDNEAQTDISIDVIDMCLPWMRPNKVQCEATMDCDLLDVITSVKESLQAKSNPENYDYYEMVQPVAFIRYKHPEESKHYEISVDDLASFSLGDLGITNGSKVFLYPKMDKTEKC